MVKSIIVSYQGNVGAILSDVHVTNIVIKRSVHPELEVDVEVVKTRLGTSKSRQNWIEVVSFVC